MRGQSLNLPKRTTRPSRNTHRLRRWVFRGLAALAIGVVAAFTTRPLAQIPKSDPTPLKDLDPEVFDVVEALLEQIDDYGAQELRAQLVVARQGESRSDRVMLAVPQDVSRTLLDSYVFPVYATVETGGGLMSYSLQIVDGRLRALIRSGGVVGAPMPDPQTLTFHYGG